LPVFVLGIGKGALGVEYRTNIEKMSLCCSSAAARSVLTTAHCVHLLYAVDFDDAAAPPVSFAPLCLLFTLDRLVRVTNIGTFCRLRSGLRMVCDALCQCSCT
jgi:hypothetical protein